MHVVQAGRMLSQPQARGCNPEADEEEGGLRW